MAEHTHPNQTGSKRKGMTALFVVFLATMIGVPWGLWAWGKWNSDLTWPTSRIAGKVEALAKKCPDSKVVGITLNPSSVSVTCLVNESRQIHYWAGGRVATTQHTPTTQTPFALSDIELAKAARIAQTEKVVSIRFDATEEPGAIKIAMTPSSGPVIELNPDLTPKR